MAWFKRKTQNIQTPHSERKDVQEGLWVKCESCRQILYRAELQRNHSVCYKCGHHFRIPAASYVDILLDGEGRQDHFRNLEPNDPLKFKAHRKYGDQISTAQQKSGHKDAVQVVTGKMGEHPVVLVVMDFSFIAGSMGSVVGEAIARAIDISRESRQPLLIVSASGGARMQEGAYSLMQMAKTSAKLGLLAEAGVPFISILTDPTTGGVTASFAMLGDINIAEPGALIGFAGQRVIKQTIGEDLPEGFQRAEFLQEKGFLDMIVPREELKTRIISVLNVLFP